MSKISPKVIDVERNRVRTDDVIQSCKHKNMCGGNLTGHLKGDGTERCIGTIYKQSDGGRFPSQLFTNIKNNRYKYVQNIK